MSTVIRPDCKHIPFNGANYKTTCLKCGALIDPKEVVAVIKRG